MYVGSLGLSSGFHITSATFSLNGAGMNGM